VTEATAAATPFGTRLRQLLEALDPPQTRAELLSVARPASGLTFTFDGSLITYRAAQHHLQALARTAGLPPFGWHTLRHTFASQLARRGATIQGIQTLLGHTTINMSLRYAHLSPDFLHATIALLNAANMREPAQVGQPVGSAGSVDTAHAAVLHA